MGLDISKHPCFNSNACHQVGRIHLPVAPKCNVMCNFCNRKFDCVNETRPGVTSKVLSPGQALHYLDQVVARDPSIGVVGIAGPGDPFANADETMETLRLVRAKYPEMLLCVATNGLNVAPYIEELAALDVSHVSITISAVDPEIGVKVYSWIRDSKRPFRGTTGAGIILERQLAAIKALKEHGIIVKINSIVIPGVNEHHIADISKKVSGLGADIHNCIALVPVENTPLGNTEEPSEELMQSVRQQCGNYTKQMLHCTRCRADAVGLLGEEMPQEIHACLEDSANQPLHPTDKRPYVAVASMEGFLVNQHLGEAAGLRIFGVVDGKVELIENRQTPERGGGDNRWQTLADYLNDCHAILTNGAGPAPQRVLKNNGIKTIVVEGLIEENLEAFFKGETLRSPCRSFSCGAECSGDGGGCG